MPIQIVKIEGLDKALRTLAPSLIAKPLHNFYQRATLTVANKAKPKTPVDMGLLRNRIGNEVDKSDVPQWGKVGFLSAREGTDLFNQARAMEWGTGRQGDAGVSHKSSHFPPPQKLDLWAHRHGIESGFVVALAIFKKGGLKAHRMLRDGLRKSMGSFDGLVNKLGDEIFARWRQ